MDKTSNQIIAVFIILITLVSLVMAVSRVRELRTQERNEHKQDITEIRTLITMVNDQNEETTFDITSQLGEIRTEIQKVDSKADIIRAEIPHLIKTGDCMMLENTETAEKHIIC